MRVPCTNYNNLNFEKEQMILMPAKYNHKSTKETKLLSSFLNEVYKNFLLKMKKSDKFGLNYLRRMVQSLILRILRRSS